MDSRRDENSGLITRPEDLQRLASRLLGEPVVGVDTESNSLYAYREQVCLIQVSTRQADYLVDPLGLEDLTPLAPLLSNTGIEKVFHAAEYDLICLRRDYGFECANVFDTMAAARILGRKEIGLGSMLEAEFGVRLDKRQQRANWGQRPLPANLLDYARLDTHYLIDLRDRLKTELEQRGLMPLAREDFERMCASKANGSPDMDDKQPDCWRISGSHDLKPQQAAVLLELCRYRDQVARSLDRPLFKVMNDQTLLAIAEQAPQSMSELSRLPGMSAIQLRRHGRHLLEAVQRGLRAKPLHPPRSRRPDEGFIRRLEGLREWRKQTALEMGVMSDVVLPRDLMLSLAEQNPNQPEALKQVMSDVPWRLEHFGSQILDLLTQRNFT
jgi:ribonuclease D